VHSMKSKKANSSNDLPEERESNGCIRMTSVYLWRTSKGVGALGRTNGADVLKT
jgi:hypothetical protein